MFLSRFAGPSYGFEVASMHTIGLLCGTLAFIGVVSSERSFQGVVVSFLVVSGQFSV